MAKTTRDLEENLKLIDLVVELTDARAPESGRNPGLSRLSRGKARIILIGKSDLADEDVTAAWMKYYRDAGLHPVCADFRKSGILKTLTPVIRTACREKIERDRAKGIRNRPIRVMVAGIPNVGKSTLINSLAGSSSLKTGNRPGVTKAKQWIRVKGQIELLDTPGLLPPKIENEETGMKLALIGSMPDRILDTEVLSRELIRQIHGRYPGMLTGRFGVSGEDDPMQFLEAVAVRRGALRKGGGPDTGRAGEMLLDDFRSGRIGRITLESPEELSI